MNSQIFPKELAGKNIQLGMPSARLVLLGSMPRAVEHQEEDATVGRELG